MSNSIAEKQSVFARPIEQTDPYLLAHSRSAALLLFEESFPLVATASRVFPPWEIRFE